MNPKRRVELLCEVSREIEKLGPMYLAMLLVQETSAREMLEELVFGKGNIDVALHAAIGRLHRTLARGIPTVAKPLTARQERSRRRLKGMLDLGERLKLRELGEPLPDTRRVKRAA